MSLSDPGSGLGRREAHADGAVHYAFELFSHYVFPLARGMRRAGMCLGSDLFGKSSPQRGINNLLATRINERQMHSLLTLLPVCAQQQLSWTLEGWAKSAFDVRDG